MLQYAHHRYWPGGGKKLFAQHCVFSPLENSFPYTYFFLKARCPLHLSRYVHPNPSLSPRIFPFPYFISCIFNLHRVSAWCRSSSIRQMLSPWKQIKSVTEETMAQDLRSTPVLMHPRDPSLLNPSTN